MGTINNIMSWNEENMLNVEGKPDKLCSKDVSRIQQNVQAHPELVARPGRRLAKVRQDARHSGALEGVRCAGEGVGSRKLATMDGQKSPSAGLKSQRA